MKPRCPICHRSWRDLPRHLAFVHQESVIAWLDLSPVPAPQPEAVWLPVAYALLSLAGLWLVVAS